MLSTLVRFWKVQTPPDELLAARLEIELIVPISYTTLRNRLTRATEAHAVRAARLKLMCPNARIAYSSCSYPFWGADNVEDRLRKEVMSQILRSSDGYSELIVASPMVNTVDEALNIREALLRKKICVSKSVLVVTGELHSRSAYYVYREVFPGCRILVDCQPYELEIQPDHPVLDQRVMWKWVLSNLKRQAALHVLPLETIRRIQHEAAKSNDTPR